MEFNVTLASGDSTQLATLPEAARDAPVSTAAAAANVIFLRTQMESWLGVLFNVFSSVGTESRGLVADVITAWVSIADAKVWAKLKCSQPTFLNFCLGNCESVQEARRASRTNPVETAGAG